MLSTAQVEPIGLVAREGPTFMHSDPTVVTLDDLICIFTVVSQADAAYKDMLGIPGLRAVKWSILAYNKHSTNTEAGENP